MKRLYVGCQIRFVYPGHPWNGKTGVITASQMQYTRLRSVQHGTIGPGYGWRLKMHGHDGDFIAGTEQLEPATPDKTTIREEERELEPA